MLNLLEGIGYTVKEEGFYNVPKKVSHVLSMHRPRFDFALAKTILFLMLFLLMDVIIPFRILLGTVSIIRLRNLRLPA
mgnify:CR=1 FL=1